jgi:hypothetical protein
MTEWIFQGNRKGYDLEAVIAASRLQSWSTPRYRDRTATGDVVWLQVVGRDQPGIYFLATILGPTYEDPDWHAGDSSFGRWRTDIRFDYRIDPPVLRAELVADSELGSFRPFRGFQGSTWPLPPQVARALSARAAPRLETLGTGPMRQPGTRSE